MMTEPTATSPLLGRTALISGSSSGIGAGVAVAFARAGAAFVVINYPVEAEAAAAEAVAEHVRSLGAKALAVQADVSNEGEVTRLAAAAVAAAGRIDILVNNAGIGHGDTVEDMPIATWDRVIGVHLRGTFLLTHAVLPGMYASGFGRIINTASQLAYKGAPGLSGSSRSPARLRSKSAAGTYAPIAWLRVRHARRSSMLCRPTCWMRSAQGFPSAIWPMSAISCPPTCSSPARPGGTFRDRSSAPTGAIISCDGGLSGFPRRAPCQPPATTSSITAA